MAALWLSARQPLAALLVGLTDEVLWVAFAVASRNYWFIVSATVYANVYWSNFKRCRRSSDLSSVCSSGV